MHHTLCKFLGVFDKRIFDARQSDNIVNAVTFVAAKLQISFSLIILDFYILVYGNIAWCLGVLGHLLPEIWRESLCYLVISTRPCNLHYILF